MAAIRKNIQEIEKARALNHVPWCEEYEKMISGMLYVPLNGVTSRSILTNLQLRRW